MRLRPQADHYSDHPRGVDLLTNANTPSLPFMQTPSGCVDTQSDGVTLRPSHVPPQNAGILALWHTACFHDTGRGLWNVFLQPNGVQKQGL